MPESNHEVVIDGYVYPDTVTITLANDDFIGSRDYVSKDLYESVSSANDYWQAENEKLRERIKELEECIRGDAEGIYRLAKNTGYLHTDELMKSIHNRMKELGVEA